MKIPAWFCLILVCIHVRAQTGWTQFRGANGQGLSSLAPPPEVFGPSSNMLWRIDMAPGHSSPVLAPDRIFLTTFESGKLHTLGLDRRTGKLLWKQTAPADKIEPFHEFASPATPSPLVADQKVVVYFGSFGLLCYDFDGREMWRKPLPTPKSTYGTASSPILVDNKVVLVLDSNDKNSRLMGVSLEDGSTAWETARPLSSSGWATPTAWQHDDGQTEIVVLGSRRLVSYDGKTGRDLWWVDGYSAETIGVPVVGGGLLFVSSAGLAGPPSEGFETMTWAEFAKLDQNGDGAVVKDEVPADYRFTIRPELPQEHPGRHVPTRFRAMFDSVDGNRDGRITESEFVAFVKQWSSRAAPSLRAIRHGGMGDVTKSHVMWQVTRGIPEIPSPLYVSGKIYLVRDGGFLTCVRAETGELIYQERVGTPGSYCASPVAAGDRLFLSSHTGVISCIDTASAQLSVLARNNLDEKIWATPALGDRTLYARTENHLYAFSDARPSAAPYDQEFRAFADADRANPPMKGGIVFVGSSIFRQWTNVAEMLAPLPVLNRAFGGSRTGDQLVRFEQAVMPYAPRIIVYYCGSNDLKAGEMPEAIFARFKAFSDKVRRSLPDTRLLFVSSTRSPDRTAIWERVDRYNSLVRDYCAATPNHGFIDINPALVDSEGRPRFELYQGDKLHFLPHAYREFASVIGPVVARNWEEVKK